MSHYTTDRTRGTIKSLPVKELATDDCVLFMWMVDWCPARARSDRGVGFCP